MGYYTPADERQFDVLKAGHMVFRVLDSQEENPLFRSPLNDKVQNILDIGTGDGSWPINVADNFPNIGVHGVDIFPPAETSVSPNVVLEVDGEFAHDWLSCGLLLSLIDMYVPDYTEEPATNRLQHQAVDI